MYIVAEEEAVIMTASSRQEKWTLWFSSQLLCWSREKWGWRTGHVLQGAGERVIVLWGVSVKKARRMNDLLMGSLLHFPALCLIQTLLYFVVSRWCVDILITAENPVSPHCSVWRRSPLTLSCTFALKKVLIISPAFLLLCQWNATFLSSNKCCLTPIEQSKCESQWMEQPQ